MTQFLISPQTPCELPGFNPKDDILVIALPEDADGGLDHALTLRRVRARPGKSPALEIGLHHHASGAQFRIRLPGVTRLLPSSIAVLSLSDAKQLSALPRSDDGTVHTDKAHHPSTEKLTKQTTNQARKMAIVHNHNWRRDGPPSERFFDLSNPESELSITLGEDSGGPTYAIQLTENRRAEAGTADVHRAIVLAQTKPGTPRLSSGLLTQWFSNRLGGDDFRTIAWIWLGSEGRHTDPATGQSSPFGKINQSPQLAIHGQISGSIAVER